GDALVRRGGTPRRSAASEARGRGGGRRPGAHAQDPGGAGAAAASQRGHEGGAARGQRAVGARHARVAGP
ncbi:hypothetical protein RZS08_39500, partial [Arthrospira platensis SPKY1]|nr:hypothetical protein [Arthrospira platensis SPKY1]